jgi:hypothetical protein
LFRTAFTDGELRCAIAKLLNVGGLHQHTLGPDADRAGKKLRMRCSRHPKKHLVCHNNNFCWEQLFRAQVTSSLKAFKPKYGRRWCIFLLRHQKKAPPHQSLLNSQISGSQEWDRYHKARRYRFKNNHPRRENAMKFEPAAAPALFVCRNAKN